MASTNLTMQVRFAWWLEPYLYGLITVALLMQVEPDWEKVERMVKRAVRVTPPRRPLWRKRR